MVRRSIAEDSVGLQRSRVARRAQRRKWPPLDGRSEGASPPLEVSCRHVCQQGREQLALSVALGQHLRVALGSRRGSGRRSRRGSGLGRVSRRRQSASRLRSGRRGLAEDEGWRCAVVTRALGGRLPVGAVGGGEGGKPAAAPVPSTAAASATAG